MKVSGLEALVTLAEMLLKYRNLHSIPIQLDEFQKYSNTEYELLINEIRHHWSNGLDAFDQLHKSIIDSGRTLSSETYPTCHDRLNTLKNYESIQNAVITKIDEEMAILIEAESNYATISSNFSAVIEKSTELIHSLEQFINLYKNWIVYIEKGEKDAEQLAMIQKFYENLNEKIEQIVDDIDNARSMMKTKIEFMEKLKDQAKQPQQLINSEIYDQSVEHGTNVCLNSVKKLGKIVVNELANWLVGSLDKLSEESIINGILKIEPIVKSVKDLMSLKSVISMFGDFQFPF